MRRVIFVLLLMMLAACTPQAVDDIEETEQATSTTVSVSSSTPSTTSTTLSDTELEAYLVEMANLEADLHSRLSAFEKEYNEAIWGPGYDDFVEEGEEGEPPPQPTEEELFQYQVGYWQGTFEEMDEHVRHLSQVSAPATLVDLHDDYVSSYGRWVDWMSEQVTGFTTLEEFNEFMGFLFSETADGLPQEMMVLHRDMVTTCGRIEEAARDAGFDAEIGCPTPPAEAVALTVTVGSAWEASPNPVPVGDGLVRVTITNSGSEPVIPVVLDIWEGHPLNLPIDDGIVDLGSSQVFDASSGHAAFGVAYIGGVEMAEGGPIGTPLELAPGESIEVDVWSDGTLVIFDYTRGAFETGAYVVVDRS